MSAVAALGEPTRRRLYDYVVRQPSAVSRDEAADALQLPRATTAFHLDRLTKEGLLEVTRQRRAGRTGPGAGRPAKLYYRAANAIAIHLPERQYELAGRLLATAIQEADHSGESPRTVLAQHARNLGRQLGEQAHHGDETEAGQHTLIRTLEAYGFEPRTADPDIVLANCPFHSLAQQHTDLVCGMNLCLLTGLLDGLPGTAFTAQLDPAPDLCCVKLTPADRGTVDGDSKTHPPDTSVLGCTAL